MHWICDGFITPEDFPKFNKPIVWTLRDMWGFTGGCHYSEGCLKYQKSCGSCPLLASKNDRDITHKLWLRKQKCFRNLNLTLVGISHWLAACAAESSLFQNRRIEVIHNAIDESIFKPMPKNQVKESLGLPLDKKIILFGAISATQDQRKGFQYLEPTLQKLIENEEYKNNIELVIFGSKQSQNSPEFGVKTTYLGRIWDNQVLAQVYAAADVTLVPSLEEAFGKTAAESLACGTPVVSFDSTGLKDIVEHQQNGYRAKCFSSEDLANGIAWVLSDEKRWQLLSYRAREKVEQEFSLQKQVESYIKIYKDILEISPN